MWLELELDSALEYPRLQYAEHQHGLSSIIQKHNLEVCFIQWSELLELVCLAVLNFDPQARA